MRCMRAPSSIVSLALKSLAKSNAVKNGPHRGEMGITRSFGSEFFVSESAILRTLIKHRVHA
jgi:hypothetical protein